MPSSSPWMLAGLCVCMCETGTGSSAAGASAEQKCTQCILSCPIPGETTLAPVALCLVAAPDLIGFPFLRVIEENNAKKRTERQWSLRPESVGWTVSTSRHLRGNLHLTPLWQEDEELPTCSSGNSMCFFQSDTLLLHSHVGATMNTAVPWSRYFLNCYVQLTLR